MRVAPIGVPDPALMAPLSCEPVRWRVSAAATSGVRMARIGPLPGWYWCWRCGLGSPSWILWRRRMGPCGDDPELRTLAG